MIGRVWLAVGSVLLGLAAAAVANLALHSVPADQGCGGHATAACQHQGD